MLKPSHVGLSILAAVIALLVSPGGRPPAARAAAADEKAGAAAKPIRALFIAGGCCHDYGSQKDILSKGISERAAAAGGVEWTVVNEGDQREHKHSIYTKPDWAKGYDVVVHDECFGAVTDDAFIEGIVKPHADGVAVVAIHCAAHSYRRAKTRAWSEMLGIRSEAHGPQRPIAVTYAKKDAGEGHPVTQGLADWTTPPDELYNNIKVYEKTTPLATGKQGDAEAIVAWTNDFHGTRVFCTTLGHGNDTVSRPEYLDLVARGFLWAVGRLAEDAGKAPAGAAATSTVAK